jgi:hypothetical protein
VRSWLANAGPLLRDVFRGPARTAVSALWFAGAVLATAAAILSAGRPAAAPAIAFVMPAVALTLLAISLLRSQVWAMAVSFVLLAGQLVGVVGTSYELVYGIDARKATELHALGFEPRVGIALNLLYSSIASAVFIALLLRRCRNARAR